MKFYGISGSRRTVDDVVKTDVENSVRRVIENGDGIVTGGALGVDYIATELVLALGDPKTQLKIYLPIALEKFCEHYNNRARESVISQSQADMITTQLRRVFELAPESVYDTTPYTKANEESYYARNTKVIEACDELIAFQVNDSQGTKDAMDKAIALGKGVSSKRYTIPKA